MHRCHHNDGGGTSPTIPKVEEEEAAGEVAMATTARLEREEEMAEDARRGAERSGSKVSQQGGERLWSAQEQGGHSEPPLTFKYSIPHNGQIRNLWPVPIRPKIVRRKVRGER